MITNTEINTYRFQVYLGYVMLFHCKAIFQFMQSNNITEIKHFLKTVLRYIHIMVLNKKTMKKIYTKSCIDIYDILAVHTTQL